ncbi:signal peptidase I [Streptococcus oricebi]|uniref:Signal peptidase I n=1 Tax=Streptococcus oricebi TaxID=1547447 RepID=A0ABS5B2N6_9STRE|nr:signal peptidase I [Streptococcus oricebi]MBP2623082.1 signal peptidase I [Streptococcus oricebi]
MVKRDLIRNLLILGLVCLVLILLRCFVFTPYRVRMVDANSYLNQGDLVLATRTDSVERDDLVLYEVDGKDYTGRVIAKAKDSVTYMDDVLYLNNKIKTEGYLTGLKERYLTSADSSGYFTHDFTLQTLTESEENQVATDSYLILNDNRQDENDSRKFGLIPSKQVKGVIAFRLLPLKKFGFLETK